jgi:tetratricopeptide (TPR) repeat protein
MIGLCGLGSLRLGGRRVAGTRTSSSQRWERALTVAHRSIQRFWTGSGSRWIVYAANTRTCRPSSFLGRDAPGLVVITAMLERPMTLAQREETQALAGWLAALVGCVEYDTPQRAAAEATRQMALSLEEESGDAEVMAWAYEMRAWFALTQGDYREVIAAAEAGHAIAPSTDAGVQLYAQKAKAWARIGDRRQMEEALDQGRSLLGRLPRPDNLDNHFVVDPSKWDFYSMDCYRLLGAKGTSSSAENRLAENYAREVLRLGVDASGFERSPMRNAEARVTLGVVAAREGDLARALAYGRQALRGERQSVPSLLMVSRDLGAVIQERYGSEPEAQEYLDRLRRLQDRAT